MKIKIINFVSNKIGHNQWFESEEIMDLKEKRILVSLISSVLIMAIFFMYVYYKYIAGNPEVLSDLRFLGKSFLIMMPFAIGAQIIIQIVIAVVYKIAGNEDIDPIDDERDKLIALKAIKISRYFYPGLYAGHGLPRLWP